MQRTRKWEIIIFCLNGTDLVGWMGGGGGHGPLSPHSYTSAYSAGKQTLVVKHLHLLSTYTVC